jgi:threonine 3-dehydrogenase
MSQNTMRALVKRKPEEGLWLESVPIPQIGANDVLIKVKLSAICGTDVHIFKWDAWAQATVPVPLVIGHEFAGEIVEVGSAVQGFAQGDMVSAEGHITCGYCRNCRAGRKHLCRNAKGIGVHRDGAFADYVAVPAANVFKIPSNIDLSLAAIFDPLGNATHTALSFPMVGEDVLITGAGPIGCMAAAIARHVGARNVVVTDINDYRLGLASALGATRVVNVQKEDLRSVMIEIEMREGFDIGLEMSGSVEAIAQMFAQMNYGGKMALLGITPRDPAINWNELIFKGLTLKGIYGREIFETWYLMASMVQSGLDVSGIITNRYPVGQFLEAFELMASGRSGKILLEW